MSAGAPRGAGGGLRTSLSGLTTRGRSFLAAGVAAAACAYVLGQGELLRVGLLLAVLPLICVYALHRTRHRVSGSASAGGKFDVGAYEIEQVFWNEVDAQGRCRHSERFAGDRLGDAVVRLYERYAELEPAGPARARAAATALSIAAMVGRWDIALLAAAFAPGIEAVDHRTRGTWSARVADALLEHFR